MNPSPLLQFKEFSILFFFINICSLARTAIAVEPKIEDCEPKSCGSIKNISYPFWISGQHPPYCGPPAFKVNCSVDGIPSLQTAYGDPRLLDIFYNNSSIRLSEAKFRNHVCWDSFFDFSFAGTPFNISAANKKLLFLHNCSREQTGLLKIPCSRTNDTFADYINDDFAKPDPSISRDCKTTKVPVLGYVGAESHDYEALLDQGFLLDWSAPDCTECRESRGQCGYNNSEATFMCICRDRTHHRSCKNSKNSKVGRTIGIGVGCVGGIIAASLLCFFWYKRRKRNQRSTSSVLLGRSASSKAPSNKGLELGKTEYGTTIFKYEELEEATDGFSASKELGDGGFGTVYKGNLRDGRVVAVKRLYEHNYKRMEQFMNEVGILSGLRHPNLVSLYGCTSRHSRELLLVYEYVPNGTVADHLHGPRAQEGGLAWPIRLSIAIETADALAYLHAAEPQIIHRDVKTNNILLDGGFHVKVADFGLSRLFPLDATHVSTAPQGTPGYVDPEYHQCYQLTDKSDVYSFGVVLAELISSKPAVDTNRTRHDINLANMVTSKVQNCQMDQLADPSLGYQTDWETKTMITLVAELAFRCLQFERETRPSIKEVLEVLRGIESGAYKNKRLVETEVAVREEASLLKTIPPYSPDSVTQRWESRSTTPNTSG